MIVHGLAGQIRSVEESETFDLAGQNASSISSTIMSAFSEPFTRTDLSTMVRITLIIGAGKQARQKYDESALKVITQVLQQNGYVEDRAASCIPECGGTYKSQHDTAKNLKTIVIFPKIILLTDNNNSTSQENNNANIPSLIPTDTPKYKIAVSSMATFTPMLKSKCPSWIQKKGCLQCLDEIKELVNNLDQKLITGKGLNDSEQLFYDTVTSIDAKEKLVKDEMQIHLEKCTITSYEKQILLNQNLEKIKELKQDNKSTEKAEQRKQFLEKITVQSHPVPLRFESDIKKLQKELIPLFKFYEQNKGKLLSIGDANKITRKEELEQEILQLEEDSRGWFEDDNEYRRKVQVLRDVLTSAIKPTASKKQSSTGTKSSSSFSYAAAIGNGKSNGTVGTTKWVLPSEIGSSKSSSSKSISSKKGQTKGRGIFGAMMLDDDSDDYDEEVETMQRTVQTTTATAAKQQSKPKAKMTKDGFMEVQSTKTKSSGSQTSSNKKAGTKSTGGGKFPSNLIDADDDDDEESEQENEIVQDDGEYENDNNMKESTEGTTSTKSKKKKKKKGNANSHIQQDITKDGTDALNEAYQKTKQRELKLIEEKKKQRENEHVVVSILRVLSTLAMEIVMSLVNMILSAMFGKTKKQQRKVK
jgi:hypothetical protein